MGKQFEQMRLAKTQFKQWKLARLCAYFSFFVWAILFSLSSSVKADDYRIAPEDVLGIVVANHPEYSADPVSVGTTGKIELPTLGTFNVTGKTLAQIQADVTQKLRHWLKKPQVTVALRQQRALRVSVAGAIARPGVLDIKTGWRLSDLLAAAGGVVGSTEDAEISLSRTGEAIKTVKAAPILADPATENNLTLRANDTIVVNVPIPQKIQVGGEGITRPDLFELRRAPRILDALTAAGWLKQKTTSSRAYIMRRGQKIEVNLIAAIDEKDAAANLPLQADDLLLVEAIPASTVYINGLVEKPGPYTIEPGSGVLEAITQAGGLATTADKINASIRRNGQNIPVNLEKIALDPTSNLSLQNNDVVLLNEPDSIQVRVSENVAKPGLLRLNPKATLLDALNEAGGLTIKREAARINILRDGPNGKQVTLNADPVALLTLDDLSQNVPLQNGDLIVVVPILTQSVSLTGEVGKQGNYELQPGDGLAEVLARAEGYTEAAALKNISVTKKDGTSKVYDLTALRDGSKVNVPLAQGDFIVVPANNSKVMVMEGVNRPGPVKIPENHPLTLGTAISEAGGTKDRARTGQIYVLRKVNGQIQKQEVALNAVYNGVPATEMQLQDGDVVFVPGAKDSFLSNVLKNPISILTAFRLFF